LNELSSTKSKICTVSDAVLKQQCMCALWGVSLWLHSQCCNGGIMLLSIVASVRYKVFSFCFARILNRFWWNSREVVTTTNILNDYILSEIGTVTRSRIRQNIEIDINRFCRSVKNVLSPSEQIHKFYYTE